MPVEIKPASKALYPSSREFMPLCGLPKRVVQSMSKVLAHPKGVVTRRIRTVGTRRIRRMFLDKAHSTSLDC